MKIFSNKAFTLIELLVVVLIIGILAAIAVPQYQLAVAKSRAMTVINVLRAIKNAQELYYLTNDKYSTNFAELDIVLPGGNIKEQTETSVEYEDGSKYLFQKDLSVYGYPKGVNQEIALEWYYDHTSMNGKLSCMENPATTKFAVCKLLGGTLRYEGYGQKHYTISL